MRGGKGAGEGKHMRTRKKNGWLAGERGWGKGSACALGKKRMACETSSLVCTTVKKTDGLRDFIFSMHYSSLVQVYQLQTVILL